MQLRAIVVVLALVALCATQAQSPPPTAEVFRGYVATATALPTGHPLPIQMRVSPDGRTLAYEGENAMGDQALYLFRQGLDISWRLIGTPNDLLGNHSPAGLRDPMFWLRDGGDSLPTLSQFIVTNDFVIVGTITRPLAIPNSTPYKDSTWSIWLSDLSRQLLLSIRDPFTIQVKRYDGITVPYWVGGYSPGLAPSPDGQRLFTSLYQGGTSENSGWMAVSVPPQGGTFEQVMPAQLAPFTPYALSATKLLLEQYSGIQNHEDFKVYDLTTKSPTTVLKSADGVMGEIPVVCCEDVKSRSGNTLFRAFVVRNGNGANRIFALDSQFQLIDVLTDDSPGYFSGIRPTDVSKAGGLIANFRESNDVTKAVASSLLFWDGSKTSWVAFNGNQLFSQTLTGIVAEASAIADDGSIFFVGQFGSSYQAIRLTRPRPTTVSPSNIQQGQDFTITGDFLSFAGLKTDLVLGAGAPVDACVVRSESELRCSSANFPVGTTTIRVRITDSKGVSVISTNSVPLTVTAPLQPISVTRFAADPITLAVGGQTTVCFATSEPTSGWAISWTGLSGTTREFGIGDVIVTPPPGPAAATDSTCVRWNPPETGDFTLRVSARGFTAAAGPIRVVVNPGPPTISSVVNAADGNALSPGVLATVYGQNFDSDAEVLVEYQPVPILFQNVTQINFQVPYEMAVGPVKIQVRRNGVVSPEATVILAEASPATFLYRGFAIITDGDWHLVGNDEEALTPGRTYTAWLTGCGPTIPAVATGQPAPADPLAITFLPIRLAFNGQEANVLWSGMAPGLIGVCQVNFVLPGTASGGNPERIKGMISIGSRTGRIEVFSY